MSPSGHDLHYLVASLLCVALGAVLGVGSIRDSRAPLVTLVAALILSLVLMVEAHAAGLRVLSVFWVSLSAPACVAWLVGRSLRKRRRSIGLVVGLFAGIAVIPVAGYLGIAVSCVRGVCL
jgi:hypothetical protein